MNIHFERAHASFCNYLVIGCVEYYLLTTCFKFPLFGMFFKVWMSKKEIQLNKDLSIPVTWVFLLKYVFQYPVLHRYFILSIPVTWVFLLKPV